MKLLRWAFVGSLALLACSAAQSSSKRKKGEVFQDDNDTTIGDPLKPDVVEDAGIVDIERHPNTKDAGSRQRPADAGPLTDCTSQPKVGDLVVVEVMVASRGGSSDPAEWVEIMNVRDCRLNLNGVRIESPRGTTEIDSVTIAEVVKLDPFDTIVVTGSADPALNNALPGKVVAWASADILKNSGDIIRILNPSGSVVEEFQYPDFGAKLPAGTSFSFPDGCKLSDRYIAGNPTVWTKKWSLSLGSWKSPFKGTPNEPNVDVGCPSL